HLVRDRRGAAEAQAFTFDLAKGSDLLVVDVTARPGVSADQLEQEVASELDVIVRDGVSTEEIGRAVALIETDFVTSMQSAADRADRLSLFATFFGRPDLVNSNIERYRGVPPKQVNDFVRARLGEDNRASLLYVPKDDAPGELVGTSAAAESQ